MKSIRFNKKYLFWFIVFPLLQMALLSAGSSPYDEEMPLLLKTESTDRAVKEKLASWERGKVFVYTDAVSVQSATREATADKAVALLVVTGAPGESRMEFTFMKSNVLSYSQFRSYIEDHVSKELRVPISVNYWSGGSNWLTAYVLCGLLILFVSTLAKFTYLLTKERTDKDLLAVSITFVLSLALFHTYALFAQRYGSFFHIEHCPRLMLCLLLFIAVNIVLTKIVSLDATNRNERVQKLLVLILPDMLISGLVLPIENLSVGVKYISKIVPSSYLMDAYRGAVIRDIPIADYSLWGLLFVLCFFSAILFYKYRKDLAARKEKVAKTVEAYRSYESLAAVSEAAEK